MTKERLETLLTIGETVAVEFKRCGGNIEKDTYQSVCSFLNRFGGDIFLGVLDDGTVEGVPQKSISSLIKNFISVIGNQDIFNPPVYLEPEIIKYDDKTIIHIYIPQSAEVHSFKKIIYDRVNDADVKVSTTSTIAQMYIRKQEIFTERKIFPYLKKEHLRLDLLPRLKIMATNNAGGDHPWMAMTDDELFKSSRLYIEDPTTGEAGFNLAAAMLLGNDDVILNVCPAYVTDALLRKVNVDRYDDREIVQTNLIESYTKLFDFAKKHLPDKFYVEDTERKSLRNIIIREMVSNTLMHREFTSSFPAKFIIEEDKILVENANRARHSNLITPENLEPYPKNPIIASFFRTIGYADQLGSGVRKLFKYTHLYSGGNPSFAEGDIFRITVPLDEAYSYDDNAENDELPNKSQELPIKSAELPNKSQELPIKSAELPNKLQELPIKSTELPNKSTELPNKSQELPIKSTELPNKSQELPIKSTELPNKLQELPIKLQETYFVICNNTKATNAEIAILTEQSQRTVRNHIEELKKLNLIRRVGAKKNGYWQIIETENKN